MGGDTRDNEEASREGRRWGRDTREEREAGREGGRKGRR